MKYLTRSPSRKEQSQWVRAGRQMLQNLGGGLPGLALKARSFQALFGVILILVLTTLLTAVFATGETMSLKARIGLACSRPSRSNLPVNVEQEVESNLADSGIYAQQKDLNKREEAPIDDRIRTDHTNTDRLSQDGISEGGEQLDDNVDDETPHEYSATSPSPHDDDPTRPTDSRFGDPNLTIVGGRVQERWLEFPDAYANGDETEQVMLQLKKNGTQRCHEVRTKTGTVWGLTENSLNQWDDGVIQLDAGPVHEVWIFSIGDDDERRCFGGDYYETDLSGPRWKSRPPVVDLYNGTYAVQLQVDPRFAGRYTFTIVLLFSNFHALHYHPQKYSRVEDIATFQIEFSVPPETRNDNFVSEGGSESSDSDYVSEGGSNSSDSGYVSEGGANSSDSGYVSEGGSVSSDSGYFSEGGANSSDSDSGTIAAAPRGLELPICRHADFEKKSWSGRWTREKDNEDCDYDRWGRWQCVDTELQCQKPWCEGPVGSLESNGWVYSAHCAFKIFRTEEAWQCLDGKWLFFWGDSNHIDTIRNLLNFFLGFEHSIKFLDRRMDVTYVSPLNNRSSLRITSMFNGHSNVTMNYEGLQSLHNEQFATQLRSYFTGETAPDVMIMNSGLHDGLYWRTVESFLENGVEYAAQFWSDVWSNMTARRPDLVYRSTIATGGSARNMSFNPHKMELFNHMMVNKLLEMKLERFQIIDGFDYTFPWHWDHKTNDGVHYGRPPSKSKWTGGNLGHRYFVDLMLVHMLLNAICSK